MMKKTPKENNDKEDNMKEMKDNIDESVKSDERNKIKEQYETDNDVIRMSMNIIRIKNENVLNLENELGNDINNDVKVKNHLFLYILIMFDICCVMSDNIYSFMCQILSLFCVLYLGKHMNQVFSILSSNSSLRKRL